MLKNIIGGMAVGIANIIPGVSGGTMLVILGIFDRLMESISEVFKIHTKKRLESIVFLAQVLAGAAVGIIGFAKIIDWLFASWSTQTFFWFVGLVLFSIPTLLKSELKGERISWPLLAVGTVVIFAISYFSPEKTDLIVTVFPELSMPYVLLLIVVGMISGAAMLFPGISGSLVLLIIGQYYIFKSYIANVTSFRLEVIIPLGFIAVGVALGILLSAKVTNHLLKNHRRQTVSLIIGLIIASAVVLIPFTAGYDMLTVVTSVAAFAIGAALVRLIDRMI